MEPIVDRTREFLVPNIVTDEVAPPPCFFWNLCSARAEVEKAGRSVCRRCAGLLRGIEYPLRRPSLAPLYLTGRAAAEALDMLDD